MEYPLTYIYLFATLAMVAVTTTTALVAPPGPVKRSLVLLTALTTAWNLTELLSNLAPTVDALALVGRIASLVWTPIPMVVLVTVLAYTSRWLTPARLSLLAVPVVACITLAWCGAIRTELYVATAEVPYFRSNVSNWYHLVTLYVGGYVIAAALILLRAARRSGRPAVARSARLLLLGVVPAAVIGVVANGLLTTAGVSTPHLGAVATALVAVVLAFGVARHRLFVQAVERVSEERYRALLDTSPDPVVLISKQDGVVAANRPAIELSGYDSLEEALAVREPIVAMVAEADRERAAELMMRTLAGERFSGIELEVESRRLGRRLLDLSAGPIRDSDREVVGVVVTGRDITERRREERERRELEAQVQQTQKLESLGVLAGGIAHDFNNLLVGILGNAGLARLAVPHNPEALDRIGQIEVAAQRAAGLAQQMLSYAGRSSGNVEAIDLAALVTELAELLRVSMHPGIELEFRLDSQLPGVCGDPVQLQQVVMSLITNAAEAVGDRGRITIGIDRVPVAAGEIVEQGSGRALVAGDYLCLEVADDGCGMPPEALARVFEPFFTTKFTGRGLGLAAVLGIARAHDGAVVIDSEEGRGTRARVYLPPADADRASGAPPGGELELQGTGTILVVDDQLVVREVARRILERVGFDVVEAEDGEAAVARVGEADGSLVGVLLDMTMPRMPGAEALERIRELAPGLPVVLMSGYTVEELGDGLDGCPFVHKPFSPETLLRAFRPALETARDR